MISLLGVALGQTFVTTPGEVRSYEIEAWQTLRTEAHPWGTDWTVPEFEVWAGILDCTRGQKREESCVWRDGVVYWGHGPQPGQVTSFKISNTSEMRLTWSPTGKLQSWDVAGSGREKFWLEASNTQLRALYHRADVEYTNNSVRKIGQRIEESLLKNTVGWLEVQWAKKPRASWGPTSPIMGPRYLRYGVASHKLRYSVTPEGQWIMKGLIAESLERGGTVETAVAAEYTWDGDVLTHVVGDAVHGSSSALLTGHRRLMVQLLPVTAETNPAPNRMPTALLQ